MTKKEFIQSLGNGRVDVIQAFLDLLETTKIEYCVIGGLAVNAYVEPVVSLDLDMVVATPSLGGLLQKATKIFSTKKFVHSINFTSLKSDLRIQLQTDPRYQEFISRAGMQEVMGYRMKVAALEDVLQGKLWAYADPERRASKRQKDLADIFRLVETYPRLKKQLPSTLRKKI
jgi:hypothetical protein